jgi:hypothetical protein
MKTKHTNMAIFTFFPSLLAIENFQNHFFLTLLIINYYFSKQKNEKNIMMRPGELSLVEKKDLS